MYKFQVPRIVNAMLHKMLKIRGFSFIAATIRAKYAHLTVKYPSLRDSIHLPPVKFQLC